MIDSWQKKELDIIVKRIKNNDENIKIFFMNTKKNKILAIKDFKNSSITYLGNRDPLIYIYKKLCNYLEDDLFNQIEKLVFENV